MDADELSRLSASVEIRTWTDERDGRGILPWWPLRTSPQQRNAQPIATERHGWWRCIYGGGKKSKPLPVLTNVLIGLSEEFPDASRLRRDAVRPHPDAAA